MILARFLTPDAFGMVGVLSVFFMIARTLMDAGLGGSLVKEKEITEVDCSTIFVFNIFIGILLYILIFLFAQIIEDYFATPGLSIIVKVLCLMFIINSIGLVPWALLTRYLQFKEMTYINIIAVFCASIVAITLAIYNYGVYALVSYQLVSALIITILSFKVSHFKISCKFSIDSIRRLLPFGIFTTLVTTIDTIYENIATFLFGKYLNMQQAGYLSQAKRLEEVPSQSVAQAISSVAFPVLNQLRYNKEQFAEECKETFQNIMLLILPVLTIIAAFSQQVVLIVFGEQWIPASEYLSLLMFAAVFQIAETLNRAFIKSTTKVLELFKFTLIKRFIGIGLIIIALLIQPSYILYAYIISTFIGYLVNAYLLSKVTVITFVSQLRLLFVTILPCGIYYCISIVLEHIYPSLIVQVIIGLTFIMLYYLIILKLYNINILSLVNKFIRK